ncbi:autotransporter outer membrane beta-barrel domain-containing protein [Lactiplantibacillus plantarum]|uniref:phage tail protein n=1 Tax=Lactiplantibacillus plantarum TaxID=1590 RepID=UPI002239003D|nr:phage tail protein [Lactiplantibacillus plantarum]MCW6101274.1 phage tail protein [Lactiplantibacillus plantarum]MCW6104401.1 phage tail protein [Lactiplantibacillus plantarum]
MAESNPTQVILTDDGIKIIKAQNTADNAASGITNLNDPNLMSVIEKQYNTTQFAGLTSQYNVLVQNAKDDGIDTTAVTTAYNNLNQFMADVLADPDHASDIDRVTYKKYQDAYNEELANLQNALQNNANNKFTSAANAASQAAIATSQAFSAADSASKEAQSISNQVDSSMSVQSQATAKAQSTADSASSQAKTAIDNGNVTSQAVTALKDGSTLTIAQLGNGLADKVSNSEFGSYKYQTASQIGELVTDGAFSAYSQATARLISATVATSDFDSYKDQTARDISSKVESKDFKSYQKQISDAFENTVSSADYKSDMKQTSDMFSNKISDAFNGLTISNRNLALGTATPFTMIGTNSSNQTPTGYKFSSTIPRGTVVTVSFDVSSSTGVGSFTLLFNGWDPGSDWQAITSGNLVNGTKHVSATITTTGDNLHVCPRLDFATGTVTFSNFIISESSKEVSWTPAPEDQATQSQFTQLKDNIDLRVEKKGLIAEINMQAGNTLISTSGQLTLSGKNINFDTDNPVTIPSANIDKLLVDKQLKAADISANTFTTNNGTFTVKQDGSVTAKNMTLIGGTLTSPTINTSTINSSTINGTTFNAGDIINNADNTSNFYPTTISSDGHIYTTWFNPVDAMQTDLSTGALTTKYRAINTTNPNNQYEAYDTTLQADQIALFAGHTNGKDMSFTQSVTGGNQDGYVLISPLNGITLHGDNQQITFNGTSDDVTPKGVIITPYGNINPNGTQNIWYVGNNMNMKTASFGMDGSGTYNIQFNRSLDIGNFNINTYHTITSSDNGPIHFNRANGSSVDIFAATVNYTSLVKSSLLSVKKDVQKADTAYWAQLINAIDLATYQYKTDDNTSHIRLSSIVDDVNVTKQWQLPDVFISRDENGKLNGVDDSVLLNATLATVQEQQKEIDQLNGHNMQLEARLNKLEAKLNG